jgi:hypothetical protein
MCSELIEVSPIEHFRIGELTFQSLNKVRVLILGLAPQKDHDGIIRRLRQGEPRFHDIVLCSAATGLEEEDPGTILHLRVSLY